METKYEIKTEVTGQEGGEAQPVKVLNRILAWKPGGVEHEADPRHAGIIIDGF